MSEPIDKYNAISQISAAEAGDSSERTEGARADKSSTGDRYRAYERDPGAPLSARELQKIRSARLPAKSERQ